MSTLRNGQNAKSILTLTIFLTLVSIIFFLPEHALAAPAIPIPNISIGFGSAEEPQDVAFSLQILFALTILSLAPSILIMMTSFLRIVIVLGFIKQAMGTQQMPPNQVIVGMALFLTFFVMSPYFEQVNQNALQPYLAGQLAQDAAMTEALKPMREFMFKQTRENDLALFVELSQAPRPNSPDDISTLVLVPSFIISELKTAFQIGFLLYLPFIAIDMIVASTLMGMGMMMVPPVMVSLPFKVLLFVLVDGWHLLIRSLIVSFG